MANIAVVEAFIAALGSGDAEAALGRLHDDVRVSEPAGLPMGGEYVRKAGFVDFLGRVAATYDVKIHRATVHDAGEVAVAHLDLTWTAHATGASLNTRFCELYTVDGDKIAAIDVYPKDTRALYELLTGAADERPGLTGEPKPLAPQ
jgi:limonene-1,2-epoxide hydrolase